MPTDKLKRLKKHAKDQGYVVDKDFTDRIRNSLSDAKINLRVSTELKEQLIAAAKKRNIPYQRYIKILLVDAILREKVNSN
jgi:predicted DNA binding CopG/RHH family protein